MFNRQPFNRGKFNVPSSTSSGNSGLGQMTMSVMPVLVEKLISANGTSSMLMKEITDGTNNKFSQGISNMILDTKGIGTKEFIVSSETSNMKMATEGSQSLAGESIIMLEGINLQPGDEIIINSCDMTITVNGQNAMEYFSSESEFFNLLNGLNKLIYSDKNNGDREMSFDVIWKDKWL